MSRWRAGRNWGARIHEPVLAGMPAVVLENERLRVTILAGKGTDVVEFNDKRRDLDFVWLSPGGLRNPRDVAGLAATGLGPFLDSYPGGWQEVLPGGGAPSVHRGAALAQHGEVSTVPWDYAVTADSPEAVAVRFDVATPRFPLRVSKTVRLRAGDPVLEIEEELVNEAPVPVEAVWGQHITFGAPFLRPGCRIRLPDGVGVIPHGEPIQSDGRRRVAAGGPYRWPLVPGAVGERVDLSVIPPAGEPSDIVYLTGADRYDVVDPQRGAGLRVRWDAAVLPYLWLWQELGGTIDYPWWGRAYVVGLEPFSSYPTDGLATAVANGTALRLAAGQRLSLWLSAQILSPEMLEES